MAEDNNSIIVFTEYIMKKYFYSILAAFAMIFAVSSCTQDDELVNGADGSIKKVKFSIELPTAMQTRAVSVEGKNEDVEVGGGDAADQLIYALYEKNKMHRCLEQGVATERYNGVFEVSLDMINGLTYEILFLAYNENNCAFQIDDPNTVDLQALTLKDELDANKESYDAFVACHEHEVNTEDVTYVTLKRPFAQINAATTTEDLDKAKKLYAVVTSSQLEISNVPTVYNVFDGTTSGEKNLTYKRADILNCTEAANNAHPNEAITVNGEGYNYLTLAYVLAGADADAPKSMHDATFTFYRPEEPQLIRTIEIPNLPIQRNYRTNVIGNLLTKTEDFIIVIDSAFNAPDHNVNLWEGEAKAVQEENGVFNIKEAAELAWIAQQVNSGKNDFAGKTVKLVYGLDLAGKLWTPIGESKDKKFDGSFDGNGQTITGLNVETDKLAGLFGYVGNNGGKKSVISNVVVEGATINNTAGNAASGVIAGYAHADVEITGVVVKNAKINGHRQLGGIAGNSYATITGCTVDGIEIVCVPNDITTRAAFDNGDKVGGIVGLAQSDVACTISNNTVKNAKLTAYRDLGGIAGAAIADNMKGNTVSGVELTIDQVTNFYELKDANVGEIVGRVFSGTIDASNTVENVKIEKTIMIAEGVSKADNDTYVVTSAADAKTALSTVFADIEESAPEKATIVIPAGTTIEWQTGAAHGSTPLLSETCPTELTIDGEGVLKATGSGVGPIRLANSAKKLTVKNITVVDATVSYDEGAWEFTYLEFGDNANEQFYFENVTFTHGIMVDGAFEFVNCNFESSESSVYSVWVNSGKAKFTGCHFTGTRAAKVHEAYGSEVEELIIDNCEFVNIEKKPGLAIGTLNAETKVEIKNSKFYGCQPGDQGLYIYETDTDVTTFDFVLENNEVIEANKVVYEMSDFSGSITNTVVLMNDIAGNAGKGGYNMAGIIVNGGLLDGQNNTLHVDGANGTWDCAVYHQGGTVKNLKVEGAFRGIFTA